MNKKLIPILLILVVAISCSENSPSIKSSNMNFFTSLKVKGDDIIAGQTIVGVNSSYDNSLNKFNFVGQDHNSILSLFMQKRGINKLSRKMSISLATPIAYDYLLKHGYTKGIALRTDGLNVGASDFATFVSESLLFLDSAFFKNLSNSDTLSEKFTHMFDEFAKSGRISENNAIIAKQHLSQLLSCPDLNTMLALNNLYINEIVNSGLSDSDKQIQLTYLSILSHSLYFWYSQTSQGDISGRAWWKWLIIGAVDGLAGFISSPVLAGAVGGVGSGIATDMLE